MQSTHCYSGVLCASVSGLAETQTMLREATTKLQHVLAESGPLLVSHVLVLRQSGSDVPSSRSSADATSSCMLSAMLVAIFASEVSDGRLLASVVSAGQRTHVHTNKGNDRLSISFEQGTADKASWLPLVWYNTVSALHYTSSCVESCMRSESPIPSGNSEFCLHHRH